MGMYVCGVSECGCLYIATPLSDMYSCVVVYFVMIILWAVIQRNAYITKIIVYLPV